MNDKVTIKSIMDWFKEAIENKHPVSPEQWLDSAAKLNVLAEDLDNEIAMMESKMAKQESVLIEADVPVSKALILKRKVINYADYKLLLGLRNRVTEHIRIAKQRQKIPML